MADEFCHLNHYAGMIGVIIFLFILGFVVMIIFFSVQPDVQIDDVPRSYTFGSQVAWGSSSDGTFNVDNASNFQDPVSCVVSNRTILQGSNCSCRNPFFGPSCQYQSYLGTYKEIGPINRRQWNLQFGSLYDTSRLSFTDNASQDSCTALCNNDPTCAGALFQAIAPDGSGKCQMLTAIPVMEQGVNLTYNTEANVERMYLRYAKDPLFDDRVIFYRGALLWRYWLLDNVDTAAYSYLRVFPRLVYAMNWKPEQRINDGQMLIVIADQRWDPNSVPNGVRGVNWFVITQADSLSILPDWSTYYVVVYPTDQIPTFLA